MIEFIAVKIVCIADMMTSFKNIIADDLIQEYIQKILLVMTLNWIIGERISEGHIYW